MGRSFGEEVRSRREARGLQQWELAAVVGCSRSLITKIEGGYLSNVEIMTALGRELDIDLNLLKQLENSPAPEAA